MKHSVRTSCKYLYIKEKSPATIFTQPLYNDDVIVTSACAHVIRKVKGLEYSVFNYTCCIYLAYLCMFTFCKLESTCRAQTSIFFSKLGFTFSCAPVFAITLKVMSKFL